MDVFITLNSEQLRRANFKILKSGNNFFNLALSGLLVNILKTDQVRFWESKAGHRFLCSLGRSMFKISRMSMTVTMGAMMAMKMTMMVKMLMMRYMLLHQGANHLLDIQSGEIVPGKNIIYYQWYFQNLKHVFDSKY